MPKFDSGLPPTSRYERRLAQLEEKNRKLEERVQTLYASNRQLEQIISGDTKLRLPALVDTPALIRALSERVDQLADEGEALKREFATLKELIEENNSKPAGESETTKTNNAIQEFALRYDSYIRLLAMISALVAAIAGVIGAVKGGQPPTITGGP